MLPDLQLKKLYSYPKTDFKATDEKSVAFYFSIIYYKGV